jgi:hypothetical protein
MADGMSRQPLPGIMTSGTNLSEGRLVKTKSAEEVKSPPVSIKMTKTKKSKIDTYNDYFERVLAESTSISNQTMIYLKN